MNNKDFISELSRRLDIQLSDTSELASSLLSGMTQELQEGNAVTIQGFGTFGSKEESRTYYSQSNNEANECLFLLNWF